MRHRLSLSQAILYLSLILIFAFQILVRPPLPFLALLLIPIALAAVLHELVGGTLVAFVAMVGAALLLALDPDPARRAAMLQEAWPILIVFLAVGPLAGWLVTRERQREHELASTAQRLGVVQELERERARALAAISEAGREIAASLDLERTLQLVITKAAETLPMDAGVLFVFDETSSLYRIAVSHNVPPEEVDKITFAFDEGVPGWVVNNRQPLVIGDARKDERVHPNVVEQGVQSVLAIPLITREQVVGVLNLFCQTGTNAFDDEALMLAQVYADQAAVFIDNARLVEELRQAAVELEARVEQRTRELRQSQAQVIRAEKMAAVGRLAASVAHEVNNPLQAITLHLQLISDEGLSPPADQQISVVQHELDRIADIVQRLLDFQRPKGGLRSLQSLPLLLDEVLALAGKQLQQANVIVTRDIDGDVEPVMAAGDQLKQVFLNLVLNAVEAMPDGGELRIHCYQANGAVGVSFTDTGLGIGKEDMDHLFEPFFSTKHAGTGLGLAVSQEIVASHGGTLEASNVPEQGASFTVTLPAERKSEVAHVA